MKTLLAVFFVCVSLNALGQSDTIFKTNGEIIPVEVTGVNESTIDFVYPGESFSNSVSKSSVLKIHFKSGRKQEFASTLNVLSIKSCLEWENVQISKIESEVKGLFKIGNVGAKAKGATTMSSLAKLQDRAYNKIKIETAMLGGNVVFLIEQNTEEAVYGGEYSSSKTPGVTLAGLAYTSKKTMANEIKEGSYTQTRGVVLKANSYNIEDISISGQKLSITKESLFQENGFQKINFTSNSIKKVSEFQIIYADEKEIILSAVYSTKQGKKTYYNLFFQKD